MDGQFSEFVFGMSQNGITHMKLFVCDNGEWAFYRHNIEYNNKLLQLSSGLFKLYAEQKNDIKSNV